MANGGTIYAGRTVGAVAAGRAVSMVHSSPNGVALASGPGALCRPVQCCCKGPWNVGPGETLPLVMDWSRWLYSVPGYNINAVAEASLYDMTVSPPAAADPDEIKVISGTSENPDPPDNGDVAALIDLMPPAATQALIEVSPNARIGKQYRLNVCLVARDCDGRKIKMCDCVVIVIAEC